MTAKVSFQQAQIDRDDARLVWHWRRDPKASAMSYHPETRSFDEFWQDYRDHYFLMAQLPPLFVLQGAHRVGFIRLRSVDQLIKLPGAGVDVSINIAPEARGRGLGSATLVSLSEYLTEKETVDYVLAEIKQNNAASINAFQKAGYQLLETTQKYVQDIDTTYDIVRYVCWLKDLNHPDVK